MLASKSADNLETEASSAPQEIGRQLVRDEKEVNLTKLARFGEMRCTEQNWQGFKWQRLQE